MENPGTHPKMMVLKVSIDADKLSIPIGSIGELASYLIGCTWPLTSITRPLGPHIEPIKDHYGNTVGQWQIQNGGQPFPE